MVALRPETLRRLHLIEAAEGIPTVEIVHQAVDFWTMLDADERRAVGLAGMSMALKRVRGGK